jgi:hypothetical protein
VVLTAGTGVLPDIDHPDSTIARSFGFVTEAFAGVVARLSGGSRPLRAPARVGQALPRQPAPPTAREGLPELKSSVLRREMT